MRIGDTELRQQRIALAYLSQIWYALWQPILDIVFIHYLEPATSANIGPGMEKLARDHQMELQVAALHAVIEEIQTPDYDLSENDIKKAVQRKILDVLMKEPAIEVGLLEGLFDGRLSLSGDQASADSITLMEESRSWGPGYAFEHECAKCGAKSLMTVPDRDAVLPCEKCKSSAVRILKLSIPGYLIFTVEDIVRERDMGRYVEEY